MKILLHTANEKAAVALIWEPRDLWVGVYWDSYFDMGRRNVNLYVCLVPLLPIRLTFVLRRRTP